MIRNLAIALLSVLVIKFASYGQVSCEANESLRMAEKYEVANDQLQAVYYYNIAAYKYWNNRNIDSSIITFKKVLELSRVVGNLNAIRVACTNLGLLYSEKSSYEESTIYFSEAIEKSRSLANKNEVANSLINLSSSYIELKNYSQAEVCLNEVKGIAAELKNESLLKTCFFVFSQLYEKQGDSQKANESFIQYSLLVKRIQDSERDKVKSIVDSAQRKVDIIAAEKEQTFRKLEQASEELEMKDSSLREFKIVSREQQMQIDLLHAEMKLRDVEIAHQRLMHQLYIGIAIISALISLLIYYAYREKNKANKLLNEKNSKILSQKEEISQQAEKLRDINAMKDKLFSIIAHDLRSPLFSLMALLNIMKTNRIDEKTFKHFIDDLSVNVSHTSLLLENLLAWAKNQMQGTKVNIETIDLNEVIGDVIEIQRDRAQQKQIGIANYTEGVCRVMADKNLLEIVLRNLISNSIKFCDSGDSIKIVSTRTEGIITICVKDSGIGMEPNIVKKLFGNEIVSKTGTKQEKGTGLGLILCREFVELMNGTIWAESEVGKGSRFYFTLPIG